MSVIIPLYILFPFIYDLTKKYGLWFLLCCFIFVLPIEIDLGVLKFWILPYALGIYISRSNAFVSISSLLDGFGLLRFAILVGSVILISIYKTYGTFLTGANIDWLFGGLVILLTFEVVNCLNVVRHFLSFLGKHLFNIFLFHTFIYSYYFKETIYSFRYPWLIFVVLLSVCLMISMFIEVLKKWIAFYKLSERIERFRTPDYISI